MQNFIEATLRALQAGDFDAQTLPRSLEQLGEQLEAVENQYSTAPEGEEDVRLALLHGIRLYQLCLDLIGRYLEQAQPELLERAREVAEQAEQQLDELEDLCAE